MSTDADVDETDAETDRDRDRNRDQDRDDAVTLTMYADYVCPFCYLGKRSLERYQETRERPLEIDWHPFDLRSGQRKPDGSIDRSVDDGKDEEYYEQAKANVRRLQERYDVEMTLELALEVDSLDAQVASFYVQQNYPDRWTAFDEAIYDALWQDGRDIGDVDVLAELAAGADVPEDEIRTAVGDEDLRSRLEQRFTDANQRGVTGVPTFVYDGYAARGAVPPEHLERLIEGTSS